MATKTPFILKRGTEADLDDIIKTCWAAFNQPGKAIFQGLRTEDDFPRLKAHLLKRVKNDPSEIFMLARDPETNQIAAVSEWRLFLSEEHTSNRDWDYIGWMEGEMAEKSKRVVDANNKERREANPGPYVYLALLATAPEYQKKGAGGQLLRWGLEMADHLTVAAYLEASPDGEKVYPKFGYVALGKTSCDIPAMKMRRPAKSETK